MLPIQYILQILVFVEELHRGLERPLLTGLDLRVALIVVIPLQQLRALCDVAADKRTKSPRTAKPCVQPSQYVRS